MKNFIKLFFLFEYLLNTACFNDKPPSSAKKETNSYDTIAMSLRKPIFEEHFDSGLLKSWQIQRYSFPENGCEMKDSQVIIKNSIATITVELNLKNKAKLYKGGEIGTEFPFLYGLFSVRMKNQIAPGTVSAFFLMNKWRAENWEHKEIDIEFLGNNTRRVQFTVHHYKNGGINHAQYIHTHKLGFDSSDDFHEYSILWTKDSISWLIDNKFIHSEKRLLIDEEMYIRINHWAAEINNYSVIKWLGKADTRKFPSRVYYDYIRYSRLK